MATVLQATENNKVVANPGVTSDTGQGTGPSTDGGRGRDDELVRVLTQQVFKAVSDRVVDGQRDHAQVDGLGNRGRLEQREQREQSEQGKVIVVVGLCGLLGAGKDTVADFLEEALGFRRASFAGLLKDLVAKAFGWRRDLLEGRSVESRQWRDQVCVEWAAALQMPGLTPRKILQQWGTDVVRDGFHAEFWVRALHRRIASGEFGTRVVVTDCRFPNEAAMLRQDLGGQVWRVSRGPVAEWERQVRALRAADAAPTLETVPGLPHASEWAWMGCEDVTVENDGTLQDLRARVLARAALLVQAHLPETHLPETHLPETHLPNACETREACDVHLV